MDSEVIVVGAGPAGLMLAGELRLAKVAVTVLERPPEPTRQSRGLGFTARTLEGFGQRGPLSPFEEVETSNGAHFRGRPPGLPLVRSAPLCAENTPPAP